MKIQYNMWVNNKIQIKGVRGATIKYNSIEHPFTVRLSYPSKFKIRITQTITQRENHA